MLVAGMQEPISLRAANLDVTKSTAAPAREARSAESSVQFPAPSTSLQGAFSRSGRVQPEAEQASQPILLLDDDVPSAGTAAADPFLLIGADCSSAVASSSKPILLLDDGPPAITTPSANEPYLLIDDPPQVNVPGRQQDDELFALLRTSLNQAPPTEAGPSLSALNNSLSSMFERPFFSSGEMLPRDFTVGSSTGFSASTGFSQLGDPHSAGAVPAGLGISAAVAELDTLRKGLEGSEPD